MEFEPIFPPGFHDIEIEQVDDLFVNSFPNNERRRYLTDRFKAFIERFLDLGLSAEIWLDGSYSTAKPEPDDIDILLVFNPIEINSLPVEKHPILNELFNRELSKIRYNLDVLLLPSDDVNKRSYWRGWFGYSRTEIPKGIPRIYYGVN